MIYLTFHTDPSFFQHVELLEGKVRDLSEQLDRQYEISKSADRRAKRMEGDYLSLEGRLRKVEDEAQSGEVLRDGLRLDKERVNVLYHRYVMHKR